MKSGKLPGFILIAVVAVILIVADYPLGTEGKTVLLGRLCFSLGILLIGGLVFESFISGMIKKKKMSTGLLISALAGIMILLIGTWVLVSVGRDVASGHQIVVLTSCETTEVQGAFGILSYRNYIKGIDENGESRQFRLSMKSADILEGCAEVELYCYEHIRRVISYEIPLKQGYD